MNIPLDKILPNPEQPRRLFGDAELEGLAQSIRENGVIQPVVVEDAGDTYILHDGERRWRSARLAGLTDIPAVVTPGLNGDGPERRLMRALIANIQREDLSHIDQALAYQRLRDLGLSVGDISKRTGKAEAVIYTKLELLSLDPEIQDLIHKRKLPAHPRMVTAFKAIPDSRARVELAQKSAERGLSAKTIITAASVLVREAQGKKAVNGTPSLGLATYRCGKPDLPKWDALAQIGKIPPWSVVEKSARATCGACVLAIEASEQVCGGCPAVSILEAMLEANQEMLARGAAKR